MRDDPTVVAMVTKARGGDRDAWNQIVERYAPLVWRICRAHRLSRLDTDDVGQTVWLSLIEHLRDIRDPAALPGWIAATTRNECLRSIRVAQQRVHAELPLEFELATDGGFDELEAEQDREERYIALRDAFAQLGERCRELLAMQFQEASPPYREIGVRLGMKVGAIGPTRLRCLEKLRQCPALARLIEAERKAAEGK